MKIRRLSSRVAQAIFIASAMFAVCVARAHADPATLLGFSSADFQVLNPAKMNVIGHAHYDLTRHGDEWVLHGDYRYADGQYDFEHDTLVGPPGGLPRLTSASHNFFLADGTPQLRANFEADTGLANCTDFRPGRTRSVTKRLDAPPDTWVGATVMIPIAEFLRRDGSGAFRTHVFSCAPGPKIITVVVSRKKTIARIRRLRPGVVETDVKPDFGWLNVLVTPFVPKLRAWFNPQNGWAFVGASAARFYKGPQILLLRSTSASNRADTPARADQVPGSSAVKRPKSE